MLLLLLTLIAPPPVDNRMLLAIQDHAPDIVFIITPTTECPRQRPKAPGPVPRYLHTDGPCPPQWSIEAILPNGHAITATGPTVNHAIGQLLLLLILAGL